MKKKSKIKKFFAILIFISILLTIIYFFVGNYFFNYALSRNEKDFMENNPNLPEYHIACETFLKNSNENWLSKVKNKNEEIRSFDNLKLMGTSFYAEENSDNWVIVVHGYTSNKKRLYDRAQFFNEAGYNVLAIDSRAAGESEGNFVTMGWFERKDLIKWTQKIISENQNSKIVFYGVSMGASTVMMASSEENLPKNVKCIVEDCGYKDVNSIFNFQLKSQFNLPPFPIINALKTVSKIRVNFDIDEASSVNQIKKSNLPIMFIHGNKDDFVPFENVNELFDAYKGKKRELYIVENAGHNQAFKKNPSEYIKRVLEFCKKYVL